MTAPERDAGPPLPRVAQVAQAEVPTRFGDLRFLVFTTDQNRAEHVAVLRGDVTGARELPTGVHFECMIGDVFGSRDCACGVELERALATVRDEPRGVVLYLRPQSDGIAKSIRSDVAGVEQLEPPPREDERDFGAAAAIVHALGIHSIWLLGGDLNAARRLRQYGVRVSLTRGSGDGEL